MPSDNKYACPQNAHLRLSKLRFFGLRKPKTTSFYSLSYGGLAKLLFSQPPSCVCGLMLFAPTEVFDAEPCKLYGA